MKKDITFRIGGPAGYGIMTSGAILSKSLKRGGLRVFSYVEYPSLIRGGHNVFTIRGGYNIFANTKKVDVLIALNNETIEKHKNFLSDDSFVISNKDKIDISKYRFKKGVKVIEVPLESIAKEISGKTIAMNSVSLGCAFALTGLSLEHLISCVEDVFCKKGKEKVCSFNIECAREGYDFIKLNTKYISYYNFKNKEDKNVLLTGNEGICAGAVKGGVKFVAAYPMTPINSILAFFAKEGEKYGVCYFQPEDEISGINSAIGASFAGVKSMTATSGGGFSLMVEAYGLAGITETPLVIIEGQRPGPATGLPTWTGQGDIRFVLHAAQDDFLRIVFVPGDPLECFELTALAFNIAYKYQVPVVVLADKHLLESYFTTQESDFYKSKTDAYKEDFAGEKDLDRGVYKRYMLTKTGVSKRAVPGFPEKFIFVANSDEHNEFGFSNEEIENRLSQMKKRMEKIKFIKKEIPKQKIYGNKNSKIGIISCGSVKNQALEAQNILKEDNIETSFLHINILNPFPDKEVIKFFKNKKKVFLFEQNYSLQLRGLIREKTGIYIEDRFCWPKFDGRQYFPEDIANFIKSKI